MCNLFSLFTGLMDGVAVRTRKIDDELRQYLTSIPNAQICILGAGLDTRAWRITDDASGAPKSNVIFEVDFPEIFAFKLPVLSAAGAVANFDYRNVIADLSLPGWTEHLIAAGFRNDLPTFWLLEGFTGYLTAEEFHNVFDTMSSLSADRSRLVATFLTPQTKVTTSMHRYTPEVPIDEVTQHAGWTGTQEEIRAIGKAYGREWEDASMDGYYIVVADYTK
jgi:methyltransferase (TIGR00027 family)